MREASVGNFTRMAGSASILAGSLATTGQSVGALVKQLLTMVGILKVTQDAELAEAATGGGCSGERRSLCAAGRRRDCSRRHEARAGRGGGAGRDDLGSGSGGASFSLRRRTRRSRLRRRRRRLPRMRLRSRRGARETAQHRRRDVTSLGTRSAACCRRRHRGRRGRRRLQGVSGAGSQRPHARQLRQFARPLTKKEMKELRQEVGGFSSKEMQDLETRRGRSRSHGATCSTASPRRPAMRSTSHQRGTSSNPMRRMRLARR
jgi:hypothetical protein